MAIPIKPVPILSGKIAEEFIRNAEERENHPTSNLSEEQEARISKIMKQLHDFKFPWEK